MLMWNVKVGHTSSSLKMPFEKILFHVHRQMIHERLSKKAEAVLLHLYLHFLRKYFLQFI